MKKRPTLTDVAVAASVSRSAAAKVLPGIGGAYVRVALATQDRIEAAVRPVWCTGR
jgi:DNA-binding LacI/PurR family transcriptional regulator